MNGYKRNETSWQRDKILITYKKTFEILTTKSESNLFIYFANFIFLLKLLIIYSQISLIKYFRSFIFFKFNELQFTSKTVRYLKCAM